MRPICRKHRFKALCVICSYDTAVWIRCIRSRKVLRHIRRYDATAHPRNTYVCRHHATCDYATCDSKPHFTQHRELASPNFRFSSSLEILRCHFSNTDTSNHSTKSQNHRIRKRRLHTRLITTLLRAAQSANLSLSRWQSRVRQLGCASLVGSTALTPATTARNTNLHAVLCGMLELLSGSVVFILM